MAASAKAFIKGIETDLPLWKALYAHYSEEHIDVVLALIAMAPHAGQHTQRLPKAAYRKGLIAGLSYDSRDAAYPECPYDAKHLPNFLSGTNDPRQAWRDGSRDGLRIREIVLWPNRNPVPGLKWRELKALPENLQVAHAAREAANECPTCKGTGRDPLMKNTIRACSECDGKGHKFAAASHPTE